MASEFDDEAVRKKAIYDYLSTRRRKYVDKVGYENWDPFEAPKDPIDIRRDTTQRTTQQLVREFLQNCGNENYGNAYSRGVLEMALGIINNDERFIGMFEFARWYQQQLALWESEKKTK